MSTKPILFSTPMVQAILDGTKTMTRRVIKPQPDCPYVGFDNWRDSPKNSERLGKIRKTPYVPGDILWVREKWRSVDFEYRDCMWSASIQYADGEKGPRVFWYDNSDVGIYDYCIYDKTGWRPSIHMPKEAARIFLRVTDVRVGRVQDITQAGALAEGIPLCPGWKYELSECYCTELAFADLWNRLNAKRGYGWDKNPWVWVYSFERVDKPAGWPSGEGGR